MGGESARQNKGSEQTGACTAARNRAQRWKDCREKWTGRKSDDADLCGRVGKRIEPMSTPMGTKGATVLKSRSRSRSAPVVLRPRRPSRGRSKGRCRPTPGASPKVTLKPAK